MVKKTTKKKTVKKTKAKTFGATLTLMGKKYVSKGKTALEAIQNLKPEGHRGVGILILESGGLKREKIINRVLIYRLFADGSPLMKEIATKQISGLFGL